ncbi:hypothetical protein [Natronospora cellulosivora (SeqCode)]
MKKMILISILFIFLFLNVSVVEAVSFNIGAYESFNIRAGISYNTYSLEELNKFMGGAVDGGISFNISASESYETLAIGIELEHMFITYDLYLDRKVTASNTGLLVFMNYKITDNLRLNTALGSYMANINDVGDNYRSFAPGAKLGLEGNIGVTDEMNLAIKGNYRFASVGDVDFSGFEIGLLGEYKF